MVKIDKQNHRTLKRDKFCRQSHAIILNKFIICVYRFKQFSCAWSCRVTRWNFFRCILT